MRSRFTPKQGWISFAPDLADQEGETLLLRSARALKRGDSDSGERLAADASRAGNLPTEAAIRVLLDLIAHGWQIRVVKRGVQLRRPLEADLGEAVQRERIRAQHQRAREEQIRTPAVRSFIRSLETRSLFAGRFVSIFDLMRDGRELAASLHEARRAGATVQALKRCIRPVLEMVREGESCATTGLKLGEIWRYFRHTWANAYVSVPGRSMMVLVRDDAHASRPIIGIASLGSPVVQSTARDRWIGWEPDIVLDSAANNPSADTAKWFASIIDRGIGEHSVDDFLAEGVLKLRDLKEPTPDVIKALDEVARLARDQHFRGDPRERKRLTEGELDENRWEREARSDLFRSRRAAGLASLLLARLVLNEAFKGSPSIEGLRRLLASASGRRIAATLVRRAKSEAVGISLADIMVCGAVPPYSHLLGGKLVAMLLTSPEVVNAYSERYSGSESVIASSIAGRPICRPARLVALSTTSLFGIPLNQYTGIKIPTRVTGTSSHEAIRYERLGTTLGFGSFQFSKLTSKLLIDVQTRAASASPVNWVFGEGVNPRMRAIREGLDTLSLPSDEFLNHGSPRVVYGVSLARNMRNVLLGIDRDVDYFLPPAEGAATTAAIADWWLDRWLAKRVQRDDVLERVAQERVVFPIRHGARVKQPLSEELPLLPDE